MFTYLLLVIFSKTWYSWLVLLACMYMTPNVGRHEPSQLGMAGGREALWVWTGGVCFALTEEVHVFVVAHGVL